MIDRGEDLPATEAGDGDAILHTFKGMPTGYL